MPLAASIADPPPRAITVSGLKSTIILFQRKRCLLMGLVLRQRRLRFSRHFTTSKYFTNRIAIAELNHTRVTTIMTRSTFSIFSKYIREFFSKKIFGGNLNHCILFLRFATVFTLIKFTAETFRDTEFFPYEPQPCQ